MATLEADSGGNKGYLSNLLEAICRDFRQYDEANAAIIQNAMDVCPDSAWMEWNHTAMAMLRRDERMLFARQTHSVCATNERR